METDVQPIDITDSPEVLRLAEEVRRSGVSRVLMRGGEEVAVLVPLMRSGTAAKRRRPSGEARDAILNIIGIGESAEPTDIARHEREYLADAHDSCPSQEGALEPWSAECSLTRRRISQQLTGAISTMRLSAGS